ncbi:MAG: arylsulfatase [Bacteroidales bacterium]|nr:arylsulfatase [Bacteroidales bacterium]
MKAYKTLAYVMLIVLIYSCNGEGVNSNQPNIIFILADDMSYRDLSCYGQTRYQTPNLDNLAANGIRFTNAYAASAECAPSRASLMTGLHTGRSPIRVNSSARGQDNLKDEDITIAEFLKDAGYNTGFTGKWGIGLPGTEGVPYKQGFDYCFGFYDQTRAHTYIPYYLWENDKKVEYPQNQQFDMVKMYNYNRNKSKGAGNHYDENGRLYIEELDDPYNYVFSENEIEKAALKFIDKNNPTFTRKPFFLYYATQLPHGPVIIDELGAMKEPANVNQKSREWAAMVIKLDKFVGNLVKDLKQKGIYDNTIIFFASDNGYSMCGYMGRGNAPHWPDDPWLKNKGPFTGGKFSVQEGGVRVPFFVSWPAKYKPAIVSKPVWLPDFFPTAATLAGRSMEKMQTDGINLVPLFEGRIDDFSGHDYMYFSRRREQSVRMGPWKAYRRSPDSKAQLYLLEEDSYTERNLAGFYPDLVKQMEHIMNTEHEPHEWYWNPNETADEYQQKVKRADETGNKLPKYYPNNVTKFPWEK